MIRNLSLEIIIPILWQREAGKITGFLCIMETRDIPASEREGVHAFEKTVSETEK